jgi:predicted SAM-dependent methyltransferase
VVHHQGINMKLDIGSGFAHYRTPLEEWTHQDGTPGPHTEIVCDWKAIPLPTESVEEIHLGDVIEHIPMWDMDVTLGEWNRILKMGGIFHGSTPNIDRLMRDYADGKLTMKEVLVPNLFGWACHPYQQHYMVYTKETLIEQMGKYGFLVDDFSRSPGPADRPWRLEFNGRKVSRATWRNYVG